MLRQTANYFASVPPVFIDGILYVCVGIFVYLSTNFGSDEAAKYISPQVLYWLKLGIGACGNIALNIKMYRSTAFADHQKEKENEKIANVGP